LLAAITETSGYLRFSGEVGSPAGFALNFLRLQTGFRGRTAELHIKGQ